MLHEAIKELNTLLREEVKGYKSMSFCDIESAEVLFSESLDANFDIDLLSEYNLEVIKSKLNALSIIGIDKPLVDVIINLENEVHIINVTKNKKYFIYLAVEGEAVKIDVIKELLNEHKVKLEEVMSKMLVF